MYLLGEFKAYSEAFISFTIGLGAASLDARLGIWDMLMVLHWGQDLSQYLSNVFQREHRAYYILIAGSFHSMAGTYLSEQNS